MRTSRNSFLALALAGAVLPAQGTVWAKRSAVLAPSGSGTPIVCLAFDTARGVTLYTISFGSTIYTYEWNGSAWTARGTSTVSGGAREFRFVYDIARSVAVGVSYDGGYLKTHEWSNATSAWVQRSVTFNIQRAGYSLAYDAARSRVVLFGGDNPSGISADTYTFDGSTWQLRATGGPIPRMNAAVTYDSTRQRVVLFGGSGIGGGRYYSDTWEWNGSYWLEAFGASGPSARMTSGFGHDAALGRSVLVGGFTASGTAPKGVWEWNGTSWSGDTTSTQPVGHDAPTMCWDPVRGSLLFAGIGSGNVSEFWERVPLGNSTPQWSPFGTGCAGSAGVPALAPSSGQLPRIGQTFTVQVTGVPPGPLRQTFGLLGASKTSWSGIPLPFDLGLIGMPGCTLYAAGQLSFPLTASSGVASWTLPLPYDVALIGAKAYQQALITDPGTNLLGAIVSNAGEMLLGL